MSKMEYMPVDCLQVPKVLFQMEKYKNLSNTAKILYSLFLDRLKFAVQNGWVDGKGDLYVIYPKSEMKKRPEYNQIWGRSGSTGTGGGWKSGAYHSEQWKSKPLLYQRYL